MILARLWKLDDRFFRCLQKILNTVLLCFPSALDFHQKNCHRQKGSLSENHFVQPRTRWFTSFAFLPGFDQHHSKPKALRIRSFHRIDLTIRSNYPPDLHPKSIGLCFAFVFLTIRLWSFLARQFGVQPHTHHRPSSAFSPWTPRGPGPSHSNAFLAWMAVLLE